MKPIKDHPDYSIDTDGNVYSNKFNKTKKLKPKVEKGYYRVGLCENGKQKLYFVHRLLAIAYLPNPENKGYINHKDSNRGNNSLDNLEWVTMKENVDHGWRMGRKASTHQKQRVSETMRGAKHHQSKLSESEVISILKRIDEGDKDLVGIAKSYKVSYQNIWMIANGKTWSYLKAA